MNPAHKVNISIVTLTMTARSYALWQITSEVLLYKAVVTHSTQRNRQFRMSSDFAALYTRPFSLFFLFFLYKSRPGAVNKSIYAVLCRHSLVFVGPCAYCAITLLNVCECLPLFAMISAIKYPNRIKININMYKSAHNLN